MAKILAALLLFLVGGAVCAAQDSAQLKACMDDAQAENEMNRCASEEAARADIELNQAYKHVLSSMNADQKARAKLSAFERAFIAYRGAYIEAMCPVDNKQSCGSIFPMEAALTFARLSREQAKVLNEIGGDYVGMQ